MLLSRTSLLLLALVACISAAPAPPSGVRCKTVAGEPGCVCQHPDGKIDLTGLARNDSARFDGIVDSNKYSYALNPCYPFSSGSGCDKVFVCQTPQGGSIDYDVGDAQEQIWIDVDGKPYLYYTGPQDRNTRVYLMCDRSATGEPKVTTSGDSITELSYVFNITSNLVCPGGASGGGGESVAGVAGIVIIFLLLGAVVAYFVVGAVIMKVKYNAAGSDIIPQKSFWFALPLLIKDGILFTFSPCTNAMNSRRGYDKA